MANDAFEGAASGAAQGSTFGPMGTAIGAGIGAISGFMSGRRRQKAARQERRRQERIRMKASPEHLADVIKSLTPMFREIVASGLGPQFQTAVADNLAKHGMTGTGVGEAFRSSAEAAPAIFATQGAMQEGGQVVGRELAAEGLAGSEPAPTQNPLLDALMGGARGFFAAGGGTPKPKMGGAPVNYGSEGIMTGQPLPNLTPEERRGVPNVFAR
jgi:hypothetical protein